MGVGKRGKKGVNAVEQGLEHLGQDAFVYARELKGFGGAVNGTMLLTHDSALVVDTLCSPRDMEPFRELAGRRAVTVVYTHADWDHCLGTNAFANVFVVSHELTAKRLLESGQQELDRIRAVNPILVEGASVILPDLTFQEGFDIDGSQVFFLPGHTEDSSVVWHPERRLLIAGDAAEDPLPSVGDPQKLGQWSKALKDWGLRASLVIPGHGKPQGPEICSRNANYLEALINSVRRSTAFGFLTPDTTLEALSPDTANRLYEMNPYEQRFYREVHKENVRRVLAFADSC